VKVHCNLSLVDSIKEIGLSDANIDRSTLHVMRKTD